MAKSKKEKLQKINEQLKKESSIIEKVKLNIKSLNSQKKKLEKQIQNEEFAELRDVLADYGIKNIEDFERFVDKNENPQN